MVFTIYGREFLLLSSKPAQVYFHTFVQKPSTSFSRHLRQHGWCSLATLSLWFTPGWSLSCSNDHCCHTVSTDGIAQSQSTPERQESPPGCHSQGSQRHLHQAQALLILDPRPYPSGHWVVREILLVMAKNITFAGLCVEFPHFHSVLERCFSFPAISWCHNLTRTLSTAIFLHVVTVNIFLKL